MAGDEHLRQKTTWGGRRPGAGRPRLAHRSAVEHRKRPEHQPDCPVHLTLRVREGLPSLRGEGLFGSVRAAIAAASDDDFRIIHFSVQSDHVHLLIEAGDSRSLQSGARGLSIRTARAINKRLGRTGKVWTDRYNARPLTTPLEMRQGLVQVLMNIKSHQPGWRGLDPCSSADWFDGFRDGAPPAGSSPAPVRPPQTRLAAHDWRRHGLIAVSESPEDGG